MMLTVDRFSDLNIGALKRIYSQTIEEMDTPEFGRGILAEQCFLEDLGNFFRMPNVKLFLWIADGNPVAALRCEQYLDGELISFLETAPEMRGRGYAKALVSSVISYWKAQGVRRIYSHVNKRNKPSLRVHDFCGFKICAQYAKLLDGTVSQNYYSMQYESTAE